MKKRILALALVMVLCLSLLPVAAFAEGAEGGETPATVENGEKTPAEGAEKGDETPPEEDNGILKGLIAAVTKLGSLVVKEAENQDEEKETKKLGNDIPQEEIDKLGLTTGEQMIFNYIAEVLDGNDVTTELFGGPRAAALAILEALEDLEYSPKEIIANLGQLLKTPKEVADDIEKLMSLGEVTTGLNDSLKAILGVLLPNGIGNNLAEYFIGKMTNAEEETVEALTGIGKDVSDFFNNPDGEGGNSVVGILTGTLKAALKDIFLGGNDAEDEDAEGGGEDDDKTNQESNQGKGEGEDKEEKKDKGDSESAEDVNDDDEGGNEGEDKGNAEPEVRELNTFGKLAAIVIGIITAFKTLLG